MSDIKELKDNISSNQSNNYFYTPQIGDKRKEVKPMNKKDIIFAILYFVCAFIFIDFALFENFNLGFTAFYFIIFIITTAYLFKKSSNASAFSYICGVLSLAGSVSFSIYRDLFINFIMVFLISGLFSIYCCGISGTFRNRQGSFKLLFDLLSDTFVSPFSNASDTIGSFKASLKSDKKTFNSIIGILVALPVLLVVIPLLVSSDAAFEGLISNVFKDLGIYLIEIVLAVIIAPYMILYMYSKKAKLKTGSEKIANSGLKRRFPISACVSFLSVISLTYIVYLFSQLAYFFSAFEGILPKDYEYSASTFARRGFFEMFAICVINIAIISVVNMLVKKDKKNKNSIAIKVLSCFISLFSVLLLITAMSKMKLNISINGLSKNRLLVSVFMLMLFIIIFFFIIHIFVPKIGYMQPIIIVCSAMFIALSFADVDGYIAKYDIEAYKNDKLEVIDVHYLGNLSDSALECIVELKDNSDFKEDVYAVMYDKIMYEYSAYLTITENGEIKYSGFDSFKRYNVTTDKACRVLVDYYNSLSKEEKEYFSASYNEYDDDFEDEFENI